MCVLGSEPPPPALRKRLRLWELPPGLHCAILGTCLGFADLVKTGRKAGIVPEPDATDYEVHAWFVQRSCEPGNLSRLLHKRLDRIWRSAVDAARAARDEAGLAAFWTRALAKGDIPGPFWALMTHPAATEDLRARAYGDVHMLSHRMGTANRDASRRLQAAEAERDDLSGRLADATRRLECHARENGALQDRLRSAEAGAAALASSEARLGEFESGDLYRSLRSEKSALEVALDGDQTFPRRPSAEIRGSRTGAGDSAPGEPGHRRQTEGGGDRMRAALEAVLQSGIAGGAGRAQADAPAIDLCGRRIAYVGGREATVRHFRALVEKSRTGVLPITTAASRTARRGSTGC